MACLHPWNPHLTGHLNVNLVVLVVLLLRDGEDFLIQEDGVFVPVLGMPLEETLCSCPSDLLQSGSKELSLQVLVRSHVLIVPDEAQHRLGRYVQLSGHDFLFPEQISVNPHRHRFDSGISPCTFQAS